MIIIDFITSITYIQIIRPLRVSCVPRDHEPAEILGLFVLEECLI